MLLGLQLALCALSDREGADAPDRHRVLEDHLADLDRRMNEMQTSRAMTEHALRCRAHHIAMCPHFKARIEDRSTAPSPS